MKGFPNVLGAIDGCHIYIRPPKHNSAAYMNRKGRASIILQGVCDHNSMFTDCFVGYPGSVHDARVFHRSPMYDMCMTNASFPNNSHLLGDSAYPTNLHLLTPFRENGHLTQRQIKYNICHAATRCIIERAFGLLKARWRRLLYLELHNTYYLPHVILAACVLHNLCVLHKDESPQLDAIKDQDDIQDATEIVGFNRSGAEKRDAIMNIL
ncbi:hypothetical protein RI129_000043 [Pyrocoelia pectoralis]|uniref:DDE Tnp4 domain-containing protein n=1 Tax=Pyrocoelia pectoralis TaxID=417401 RepID=A0AAN7ZBP0_9COLE